MSQKDPFGDWVEDAACATDTNPSAWTSTTIVRGPRAWQDSDNKRARAICGKCPVKFDCLEWALDLEKDSGYTADVILGGIGPFERRSLPAPSDRTRKVSLSLRA